MKSCWSADTLDSFSIELDSNSWHPGHRPFQIAFDSNGLGGTTRSNMVKIMRIFPATKRKRSLGGASIISTSSIFSSGRHRMYQLKQLASLKRRLTLLQLTSLPVATLCDCNRWCLSLIWFSWRRRVMTNRKFRVHSSQTHHPPRCHRSVFTACGNT